MGKVEISNGYPLTVKEDEDRIEHILANLLKLASGDFNIEELEDIRYDNLDAIDRGVVMVGEHLNATKEERDKSFQEKEHLLKEVHHRVKNNLQIISSLLNLQTLYTKDTAAKQALHQSQYRIKSMSLIHEMLYKTENISEVNYKGYLEKLTETLVTTIKGISHEIKVKIKAPEVILDIDTAVTLGLIINEIITNSLIHGLENNGEIYIQLIQNDDSNFKLDIGDNGIGFDESKDHHTLGLQLIEILSNQLEASILRKIDNGTHYSLTFEYNAGSKG